MCVMGAAPFLLSPAVPLGAQGGAAGTLSPLVVIHPPAVHPLAWALFLQVSRKGTALSPWSLRGCWPEAARVSEEQGQPSSRGRFLPGLTLAVPVEAPANRARSSRAEFQPEARAVTAVFPIRLKEGHRVSSPHPYPVSASTLVKRRLQTACLEKRQRQTGTDKETDSQGERGQGTQREKMGGRWGRRPGRGSGAWRSEGVPGLCLLGLCLGAGIGERPTWEQWVR